MFDNIALTFSKSQRRQKEFIAFVIFKPQGKVSMSQPISSGRQRNYFYLPRFTDQNFVSFVILVNAIRSVQQRRQRPVWLFRKLCNNIYHTLAEDCGRNAVPSRGQPVLNRPVKGRQWTNFAINFMKIKQFLITVFKIDKKYTNVYLRYAMVTDVVVHRKKYFMKYSLN